MTTHTTRLAPSPTGALHLGNMRTFLLNWLLARQHDWRVLFRMEDLDGPRTKLGAAEQTVDVLRWIGLDWDGPIVYQSQRGRAYQEALRTLQHNGWAFPCVCSRKDVELAAGAPHNDDGVPTYPGTCRGRWSTPAEARAETGKDVAVRMKIPDRPVAFHDEFAGPQCFDLTDHGGDFVILRKEGLAAYQLAVVVDDEEAGVDRIVRGDDLLDSAARQLHLRRCLGMTGSMQYWHLPLVVGPDGRRLAKRHGDSRVTMYRRRGATPERILGLLAYWSGQLARREAIPLTNLLEQFAISRVPRHPVVCTQADHEFLLG